MRRYQAQSPALFARNANDDESSVPNNERLAEVYRTAAQIMLRMGYDATSINDIANSLGMTKAGTTAQIFGTHYVTALECGESSSTA